MRWITVGTLGALAASTWPLQASAASVLQVPLEKEFPVSPIDLVGVSAVKVLVPNAKTVSLTEKLRGCGPYTLDKDGVAQLGTCDLLSTMSVEAPVTFEVVGADPTRSEKYTAKLRPGTVGEAVRVPMNGVIASPTGLVEADALAFRVGSYPWMRAMVAGKAITGADDESKRVLTSWVSGYIVGDLVLRRRTLSPPEEQWTFVRVDPPKLTSATVAGRTQMVWPSSSTVTLPAPLALQVQFTSVPDPVSKDKPTVRVAGPGPRPSCPLQLLADRVATFDLLGDLACNDVRTEFLRTAATPNLEIVSDNKVVLLTIGPPAVVASSKASLEPSEHPKLPWSGGAARALFQVGTGTWHPGAIDGEGQLSATDVVGLSALTDWAAEHPDQALTVKAARPTEPGLETDWVITRAGKGATRLTSSGSTIDVALSRSAVQAASWTVSPIDLAGATAVGFTGLNAGDRIELRLDAATTCVADVAAGVPAGTGTVAFGRGAALANPCSLLYSLDQRPIGVRWNGREIGSLALTPVTATRTGEVPTRIPPNPKKATEAPVARATVQTVMVDRQLSSDLFVPQPGAAALPSVTAAMRLDGEWASVDITPDGTSKLPKIERPPTPGAAQAIWDAWTTAALPTPLNVRVDVGGKAEVLLKLVPLAKDSWCHAEPTVPDDWVPDPLYVVCFDARRGTVQPVLPTGVPFLKPNQAIAVVVLSDGSTSADISVGGGAGFQLQGLADPEALAYARSVEPAAQTASTSLTGEYVATWYFAPRLPTQGPAAITVTTAKGDATKVRTATMELTPRPVYISAIRTGVALQKGHSPSYSLRTPAGGTTAVIQADDTLLRPELVVGYSAAFKLRDNLYPRVEKLPVVSCARLGGYGGLGVIGPSSDSTGAVPISFLTSVYLGFEYEVTPSTAFAFAGVLHRSEALNSGLSIGDSASGTLTHPVFRSGWAIVLNVSPKFFRFARSFAKDIAAATDSTGTDAVTSGS